MYDGHARIGALCCFVAIVSGHAAVHAEQVVVTDVTYTHSTDTTENSHYRLAPRQGSPANWLSPVDYTKGSVHILVEVKTKPGNTPTKFQICFEGDPNYACTDQSATYTATGTQEWVSPFSKFWYSGDMDWSKGVKQVALILKDTQNMPRTEAAYLPTDLRVEVTLLSQGETYVRPGAMGNSGNAGAAAPAAGAAAPAAGRAAGMAGMDAPNEPASDGGAGGQGGSGVAGAAAGAGAAGASTSRGAGAAGTPAVAGRGAAGTRSTTGASGARSAGSGADAGGAAKGSRSDADSAEDEFQYPSGNESNCSVGRALSARPTPTPAHVGSFAVLAFAFAARARRRRLRTPAV